RECGLSQSAIANYETKTRQSAKNIFVIAHALRVNAAWLAQGIGDMELAPPHSGESASYRLTDAVLSQRADVWPFRTIPSQEFWELSLEQRKIVEQTLASLIRSFQD